MITGSYLATDTETNQQVEWNEFEFDAGYESKVSEDMEYCIQCCRGFPQFFVSIQSYWIDSEHSRLITIMEYLKKGCMEDFLLSDEFSSISQRNFADYLLLVRSWIISILRMLDYIHSLPAPLFSPALSISYISFVENYDNIKLTLFPLFLSKTWRESLDHLRYLPPETIAANDLFSTNEVYSLGVCIWEMMMGKLAFDASTVQELMTMKKNNVCLMIGVEL